MADLGPAVDTVINKCLAIKPGENVLVVADAGTRSIGDELRDAAALAGGEAVLVIMDEREHDGTEPPPVVAAALAGCDAFIAPTSRSLSHTSARKRASDNGARGATMPGVTADMLARVMAVEFETMATRSKAVAELLTTGKVAHVSCPRGTHFTLELGERAGISDDGDLTAAGAFGNLPCGEGFIAPVNGEGRLVASSLAPLGISDPPATLTVHEGRLVSAQDGLGPPYLEQLEAHGELGTNLAELGVGTNDRAILTGNVLEDEKILGTVHIAFGNSANFGGSVSVQIHLDVVVLDASLDIDGRPILDGGRFVLDA
jgi:leucyl aminopeptidase (aminopeptidase T)